MNPMVKLSALPAIALLAACQTATPAPSAIVGKTDILRANGQSAGEARIYASADSVVVSIALTGFSAGTRAVHIHTTGVCNPPDFVSAGGHLNPSGHEHGTLNPRGAHLGDLPNIVIGADGSGTLTATLAGSPAQVIPQIFDADGAAIVVHAGEDDYVSDPAGDAGSRVACGVLQQV